MKRLLSGSIANRPTNSDQKCRFSAAAAAAAAVNWLLDSSFDPHTYTLAGWLANRLMRVHLLTRYRHRHRSSFQSKTKCITLPNPIRLHTMRQHDENGIISLLMHNSRHCIANEAELNVQYGINGRNTRLNRYIYSLDSRSQTLVL